MKELLKKLDEHRVRIAKERDDLEDTISKYQDLAHDLDEAVDGIEAAIEALSRLQ